MPLVDYIKDRRNRILIGGASGVGLIIASATAAIYNSWVRPAFQIEQPDGDVLLTLSDHGAIGVQSGSGVDFGSVGDCLKSGGSSGATMTFGSCGTSGGGGSNWSNTGALQTAFDARYVNQSGDTMTGSLKILNGSSLQVASSITGAILKAVNSLNSSGTLVFEGAASGSSLYLGTSLEGAGLLSCSNATTSKLLWDSTTKRFSCGTDTDTDTNTTYTAGQGLSLSASSAFSLLSSHTGTTIQALNTLASSGTLIWEATASGQTLIVSKSFSGAGLTDCDGATQTLAWDATSGRFSCGTDADTTYTAGQGLQLNSTAFRLLSSFSGAVVRGVNTLASSGTLVWETSASGAFLWVSSFEGAGLTDCDTAGTSKLLWDATGKRFSCGTDTDTNTTYTAGQGLGLNGTVFSLNASHSGTVIRATTTLASSGGLVWEGKGSGNYLVVSKGFSGAGLVSCSNATTSKLLWNSTSGRFSCGTDTDTDTNTTYTAGQGLQLNSTSFRLLTSFTGTVVRATTTLASSGTLVFEGAASGSSLTATTISGTVIRYRSLSPEKIGGVVVGSGTTVAVGSGKLTLPVLKTMSGYILYDAQMEVHTAGTTNTTGLQVRNLNKASCKMFSTIISIDSAETSSITAATPFAVSSTCRQVGAGERLVVDVTNVSTTAPKVVSLVLFFYKP